MVQLSLMLGMTDANDENTGQPKCPDRWVYGGLPETVYLNIDGGLRPPETSYMTAYLTETCVGSPIWPGKPKGDFQANVCFLTFSQNRSNRITYRPEQSGLVDMSGCF